MKNAFDGKMSEEVSARRLRGQNLSEFIEAIEGMKGQASVSIQTAQNPSTRLHQMSPGHFLYRIVCIFAHAVSMLRDPPNCMMTDGRFEILSPYTLILVHVIVANESIPIGLCITPTETAEAYELVYKGIIEELERNNENSELLTTLPLVSDQGAALESFVRKHELKWHLCHRHIVENFGASGLVDCWVARLLRCCSPEEYGRESEVIINEITAQNYGPNHPALLKIEQLKWMLFPESCTSFAYRLDHWARWLRYGSPTTSNAAESVHAKLNGLKHGRDVLVRRIMKVFTYCTQRYNLRNSDERKQHRASNKCYSLLHESSDFITKSRDSGRLPFYLHLNTNPHLHGDNLTQRWEFPVHDLQTVQCRGPIQICESTEPLTLPASWIITPPPRRYSRSSRPGLNDDF
jgi:hypothetical protein